MKTTKFLSWLMCSVLTLTACGDKNQGDDEDTGNDTKSTTKGTATTVVGDDDDDDDDDDDNRTTGDDDDDDDDDDDTTTGDDDDDDDDTGPSCGNICNIFTQDCAEGERCSPKACDPEKQASGIWDSDVCRPEGTRQIGEECTYEDEAELETECVKGAMCWGRVCLATCTGSKEAPECPGQTSCLIGNDGVLAVCMHACDPLKGNVDCKGQNDVCLPAGENPQGFVCIPYAGTEEGGNYGESCPCLNCCKSGLMCVDAMRVGASSCIGEMYCCGQFCNLENPECPSEGEECLPVFTEEKPGYENAGICLVGD